MSANALTLQAPFAALAATTFRRAPKRPMNEAKFEAFYRKTAGSLWSYIYRMTGDPAMADDLLQKSFFRFLRSNPEIVDDDHRRHYLFKTATNLVFDHFREKKRDRQRVPDVPPESRADHGELRHDMKRAFAELKPQERVLLWLAHVEGSSHDEISEAIGVKSKSVRVMLFRARKRLADILTKRGLAPQVRHG
ncbi:MAG TPA: sigma-70 family RNA polymerase sigma factor [Thermoanaerobaculia bacterium]